jgi:hypothetical protein
MRFIWLYACAALMLPSALYAQEKEKPIPAKGGQKQESATPP